MTFCFIMCTYLQLNHLYILKYKWHIISKRWACLQDKIHIHDWFYFENTVTRNMEICGLNSYHHDLITILFKKIEFLHIVKELTTVKFFIIERFEFIPMWLLVLYKRCWYIWLFNVTMLFEFLIFIVIKFDSFAPDTETAFCPAAVLR